MLITDVASIVVASARFNAKISTTAKADVCHDIVRRDVNRGSPL